jgi:hypothetical protein
MIIDVTFLTKENAMDKTTLIAASAPTLILLSIIAYLVYSALKRRSF